MSHRKGRNEHCDVLREGKKYGYCCLKRGNEGWLCCLRKEKVRMTMLSNGRK